MTRRLPQLKGHLDLQYLSPAGLAASGRGSIQQEWWLTENFKKQAEWWDRFEHRGGGGNNTKTFLCDAGGWCKDVERFAWDGSGLKMAPNIWFWAFPVIKAPAENASSATSQAS